MINNVFLLMFAILVLILRFNNSNISGNQGFLKPDFQRKNRKSLNFNYSIYISQHLSEIKL